MRPDRFVQAMTSVGMRGIGAAGAAIIMLAAASCVQGPGEIPRFRFVVVDVKQGLAQIGASGAFAVAWDMGLPASIGSWHAAYNAMGRPRLGAIVISHSDWDHCGGLSALPESIDFSGRIIVHAGEDTSYLRQQCAAAWRRRLFFSAIQPGDTIGGLADVRIECLWPSGRLDADSVRASSALKNRYSLVFLVSCGATRLLITSDIDTVAQRRLTRERQFSLRADLLVAPHHGSASAVEPVFYGYVCPQAMIISCAAPPNQYGHPSADLVDLAFQMGIALWTTYNDGTIALLSNGEYWQRQ